MSTELQGPGQDGEVDDATETGATRLSQRARPKAAFDDVDHTVLGSRPRSTSPAPDGLVRPAATPGAARARQLPDEVHDETIVTPRSGVGHAVTAGTHVPGNEASSSEHTPQRLADTPAAPDSSAPKLSYEARPVAPVIAARAEFRVPSIQPAIDHNALDRTLRGRARRRAAGLGFVIVGSCLIIAAAILLVISTLGL